LVKEFIRVPWRGFWGDDPGWPRFDRLFGRFDSADPVISGNDGN
jgi:hypothetical protein